MVISATTQTAIFSLLVSYVAYDNSSNHFVSGNYQYSSLSPASNLMTSFDVNANPSFIFGGFNGFIISNTQANVGFNTT